MRQQLDTDARIINVKAWVYTTCRQLYTQWCGPTVAQFLTTLRKYCKRGCHPRPFIPIDMYLPMVGIGLTKAREDA